MLITVGLITLTAGCFFSLFWHRAMSDGFDRLSGRKEVGGRLRVAIVFGLAFRTVPDVNVYALWGDGVAPYELSEETELGFVVTFTNENRVPQSLTWEARGQINPDSDSRPKFERLQNVEKHLAILGGIGSLCSIASILTLFFEF